MFLTPDGRKAGGEEFDEAAAAACSPRPRTMAGNASRPHGPGPVALAARSARSAASALSFKGPPPANPEFST
jgi:hypothetical protein